MRKSRIIIFITIFLGIIALTEYTIFFAYKDIFNNTNSPIQHIFILSSVFFPLLFLLSSIRGMKKFSKVNAYLYTLSVVWLGFIIYLFMGSILLALLQIILKGSLAPYTNTLGITIALASGALVIFGILTASIPRIKTWKIKSDSLSGAWSGKKILLISDTHFGQVRQEKFALKIVRLIQNENPDIVFHTGDIIDGPTFPYKKSFNYLEQLNPSLEFIYVEGNHERYSQEYDFFRSQFPKNIVDVTDRKVLIHNTQIIGLSFNQTESREGTKKRLEDLGYDTTMPSIVLLHDPKHSTALADLGVSLVLSGHTHGGQFFPSTLIVKSIYNSLSHGLTYTKKTVSVVTTGIGTAMIPIRIGTVPEIVILEIA